MYGSQNSSSQSFVSSLDEQEIRKQLLQKLIQIKQSNIEKDKQLDNLKKKSQQLEAIKEDYENKIREFELTIMKSTNNIMMLRQNLKKMYIEFLQQSQDPVDVDNMTYQELLELQEKVGHVSKGLTTDQLSKLKKSMFISGVTEETTCMVCQEDFETGAGLIVLKCEHTFHEECIGEWFKKEKVCPLCKGQCI